MRRRARDFILLAGLLAVPLLILRANLRAPSELSAVDRGVLRVTAPVQSMVASIGRWIGGGWDRYVALIHVSDANRDLQTENARLRGELAEAREKAARSESLEKLLALRKEVKAETLAARVIGSETSSMFNVMRITLDRGDAEVRVGMPVLAPEGVVGRVYRIFGAYCDVELASDPHSSIPVEVRGTRAQGLARGVGSGSRYAMRVDDFQRRDEIKVGDEVVTRGIDVFPAGRLVGKVTKVNPRESGQFQEVELQPAVDFGRLDHVLVVLSSAPPAPPVAVRK
jgi:rod shape-determining protein MreC